MTLNQINKIIKCYTHLWEGKRLIGMILYGTTNLDQSKNKIVDYLICDGKVILT